jgi:hypothetical protein
MEWNGWNGGVIDGPTASVTVLFAGSTPMAESTALTRYGLRREAGTDWDRLWLTVTHTTHSDRWLCLYLVAASIASRQQQRRRTWLWSWPWPWPWCLVLWWGEGTCRRERREERVTCLSCVFGGQELEKGIAISYLLANCCLLLPAYCLPSTAHAHCPRYVPGSGFQAKEG